jgi:hypothetical protein
MCRKKAVALFFSAEFAPSLNVQILHAAQIRDSTLFDKLGELEDQGQKQESDIGPKVCLHVCVQRLRRRLVTGFHLWTSHLVQPPDPIQRQDDQQKKRDRAKVNVRSWGTATRCG